MTMNQPRHTYRGRPSACPGPCNPLNAHHHHHHHRHHRQKHITEAATSQKETTISEELDRMLLLKYFDLDVSVTSDTPTTGVKSIATTSSFTEIAAIKVSSVSKIGRPRETAAVPPTMLPKQLNMLCGEQSTSSKRQIELISAPKPISILKRSIVRTLIFRTGPGILDGARSAITSGLNGLNGFTPKRIPSLRSYLIIVMIYAVMHVLLVILTWRTSTYQFFLSSQICGIIAILMRRITGTILM
ncbi:uncharacterized protein LOC109855128 [Pseudomyrmex gracilis]|uniref:uncharacterized protein LOC109855128 n=1 Tax=Pseudomyrmex gracilis TaxID=219809 RepID=UPI000995C8F3|nr:uncharacterized protein LOC109855128 [Pseudomyrmex gracilis]XP_020284582.1 uncharacterized protein LOC109855128 [Pseudomyrmex gracilis]